MWARLQEFRLKSKSDAIRMRLQKLNPITDTTYDDLFLELVGLDGELRRLGSRRVGRGLRDVIAGSARRSPRRTFRTLGPPWLTS